MTQRRKFQRPLGQRRYRKLFVIAVGGAKTEPQYFAIFNNQESIIRVNCLKGKHDSAPPQVLRRMKDHLKKAALKKSDEAWLVVDKDQWTDEQLAQLFEWSQEADNFGFALSNPRFEYWLLLHFEEGAGITSSQASFWIRLMHTAGPAASNAGPFRWPRCCRMFRPTGRCAS